MKKQVFLSLGSNLGDRYNNLQKAIFNLSEYMDDIVVSNIYETKAVTTKNAPKAWNMDFLNMVIKGNTSFNPIKLLRLIKAIEVDMGRDLGAKKWSPREIDIDIIDYEDTTIEAKTLIIPHKLMQERDFVIIPMSDITNDWAHPNSKQNIAQLKANFKNSSISEYSPEQKAA